MFWVPAFLREDQDPVEVVVVEVRHKEEVDLDQDLRLQHDLVNNR